MGERVPGLPHRLGPRSKNRLARGPPVQGVPEPGPVGHVIVRPRRLDDGHGQRIRPVHQRQMGRGAYVLGQRPERRQRGLPHQRMHLPAEPEHTQPDPGAAAQVTPYERMLFQRGEQPVHHGPVHAQFVGKLGDGQPVVRIGQQLEDTQSSVERLRGLRGHDAHSSKW